MHHQTLSAPDKPVCMMCGNLEPSEGWHTIGCSDGDAEFFCSEECFNQNAFNPCDEGLDDIEEGFDAGEWNNAP